MVFIVLAMLLYTAAILLGTAAARHLNTNFASLITNALSVVVPLLVILPNLSKKLITNQRFGILMAVGCGLTVGLFVMALNKSFSENKVGIVSPMVFGGAILLSTVASYFIFKEKITLIEGVGLLLVLAGLSVVIYARAVA